MLVASKLASLFLFNLKYQVDSQIYFYTKYYCYHPNSKSMCNEKTITYIFQHQLDIYTCGKITLFSLLPVREEAIKGTVAGNLTKQKGEQTQA